MLPINIMRGNDGKEDAGTKQAREDLKRELDRQEAERKKQD